MSLLFLYFYLHCLLTAYCLRLTTSRSAVATAELTTTSYAAYLAHDEGYFARCGCGGGGDDDDDDDV